MVHTLKCENCGLVLGTVVETRHLELPCPRCHQTTTFSTYGPVQTEIAAIHVPKGQEQRPTSIDKLMRQNRYIDHWKC